MVQQSLLNNESLKDFSALAILEPYLQRDKESNEIVITPIQHHNQTKMIPTTHHDSRWAIRSMLWIRKDLEAQQIAVELADITAAVLHLLDQLILIGLIYVPLVDLRALQHTLQLLQQLIESTYCQISTKMDILMVGDFNQHNQLQGGQDVSWQRQGEANLIVNFIGDYSLQSLLPISTKTWARNKQELTINLIFASNKLATTLIKCGVYGIEHGLNHKAIEMTFNVAPLKRIVEQRLLFKNTLQNAI